MLDIQAMDSSFKTNDKGSDAICELLLPAGVYFIGDPCYAFGPDDDPEWQELVNIGGSYGIFATVEGHPFAAYNTAYGDGFYPGHDDLENISFPVDAGLVGVIPEVLTEKFAQGSEHAESEAKGGLLTRIEFTNNVRIWSDHLNTIHIETIDGNFKGTIPTDI